MNPAIQPMLLAVALPLAGGLLCLITPARAERVRVATAMATAALTLAFAASLMGRGADALEWGQWLALRGDRLSGLVLLLVALFGLLIAVYSTAYMRGHERHRAYFAYLQWTIGAAGGVLLANDLVLLLVCWGFLAVTLYTMITLAGEDAAPAARKSLLTVGGSDALLLLGAVLLWQLNGSTRMDLDPVPVDDLRSHLAFLAFAAAAFAKAGAVPLHAWVPDCAERAQAPVTALLPASLDKLLGIYLLVRAATDLFVPTPVLRSTLMAIGALAIVVAVLLALVQHDLKRLLGYCAVSQVGYMVLGIGTGTAVGIAGALFHMLNHAIYKSCLFLGAGAIEQAAGSTDLDQLGGLGSRMPATFATTAIASMAISGIPPFNGFASKWMVYQSIVQVGAGGGLAWVAWLAAAMVGSALTLATFVKVLHAVFLCGSAPELARRRVREASAWMLLPMVVLAALCVVLGVFASSIALERLIGPAVPGDFGELWDAGLATVLLLTAVGAGALVYWLTMRGGRMRRVETYVGGERLDEVYIRDVAPPPSRDVRVTGADFYRTVERLPAMRRFYRAARGPALDLYEAGRRCLLFAVVILRAAHTGALPSYLTWFLFGVLALVYLITHGGS